MFVLKDTYGKQNKTNKQTKTQTNKQKLPHKCNIGSNSLLNKHL